MRWRRRGHGLLAAPVLGLAALSAGAMSFGPARAGTPISPPTTNGPTTTQARSTTSTASLPRPQPTSPSTSPTTAPARAAPAPSSTEPTTTSTTVAPSSDAVYLTGHVPPDAQARIDAIRRTAPGSTAGLLAALAPLQTLGYTATQAAVIGFGRFPVAGPARWADDFLEPRFGADGSFAFHEGNDIPAACGTPIRSPSDGTVRPGADPAGGNNVIVTEADGTYLYMAHLSAYPAGQVSGSTVKTGDVIGFVGQTGAATGCHVHFEIHPRGGDAVDPKAFLDAWASEALAAAPVLVDAVRADHGLAVASPTSTGAGVLPVPAAPRSGNIPRPPGGSGPAALAAGALALVALGRRRTSRARAGLDPPRPA